VHAAACSFRFMFSARSLLGLLFLLPVSGSQDLLDFCLRCYTCLCHLLLPTYLLHCLPMLHTFFTHRRFCWICLWSLPLPVPPLLPHLLWVTTCAGYIHTFGSHHTHTCHCLVSHWVTFLRFTCHLPAGFTPYLYSSCSPHCRCTLSAWDGSTSPVSGFLQMHSVFYTAPAIRHNLRASYTTCCRHTTLWVAGSYHAPAPAVLYLLCCLCLAYLSAPHCLPPPADLAHFSH